MRGITEDDGTFDRRESQIAHIRDGCFHAFNKPTSGCQIANATKLWKLTNAFQ
jgi:hypothetical protein